MVCLEDLPSGRNQFRVCRVSKVGHYCFAMLATALAGLTGRPWAGPLRGLVDFHPFDGGQEMPQAAYWNWDIALELVVVR
jgi:hypothetical protein